MSEPENIEVLKKGTVLAHYEILEKIAQGGMGIVYKAFEPALEREVAIKVLMSVFAAEEQYVKDFQGEAQLVAALRHPHIIPIYYIGQENGLVFFSMAYIQNKTLDSWIQEGRLMTYEEAKWFLTQAVSALEHAAESNIIHLDIKPSNFLLDEDHRLVLADFGLAKNLGKNLANKAGGKNVDFFGTPGYVSPEQIRGESTDLRTDIYSLGATLFHLLVGQSPYSSTSVEEVVDGHLGGTFPREKAFAAGIQVSLVQLLEKMLEKDPSRRFQNYAELKKSIDKLETLQYHSSQRHQEKHEPHKTLELPERLIRLKELPGLRAVATMNREGVQTLWSKENEAAKIEWARATTQKAIATGETLGLGRLLSLAVRVNECQIISVKDEAKQLMMIQDEGGDLESMEVLCQEIVATKN